MNQPLIHERRFRVRHYECDPFGHVNHANYLRYMQETAFDASAAAGYSMAHYEGIDRLWWVRETDISYLQPLTYGDTVIVHTWVMDFRRFRSRRAYELRRESDGELVASAATDWVFLEASALRPTLIPSEMVAAFWPNGEPKSSPAREPFPTAPPPPPGVFVMRRAVEWQDLDMAQHVNNAVYLTLFEASSMAVGAAHGWTAERMMAEGFGIVARRYRILYKQQACFGDELELATWVSDVKRATAVRHYAMSRVCDGALLARAHVLWVWVDLKTGRPIRIPDDFRQDFGPNIVDG
ncbi:MAG: thioesterase family protein [Caldilineales bacterium]|nr:thioesterase family protein [Caldilineales bacterium]